MKKFQTGLALALSAMLCVSLFSGCMTTAKAAQAGANKTQTVQEMTSNGCTIRLKSARTDGHVARILLGITAPESTRFPTEETTQIGFFNYGGTFTNDSAAPANASLSTAIVDDGDGKANTVYMQMEFWAESSSGKPVYAKNSVWKLNLVDLQATRWDANTQSSEVTTLADGAWEFSVRFDDTNMDLDELELISSPVEAKASVGFREDGEDVMETFSITSVKLRAYSSQITGKALSAASVPEGAAPDFYTWPGHQTCAVMKDGTQVKLHHDGNQQPIDLSQVDHVLLADGTKLPAVQK